MLGLIENFQSEKQRVLRKVQEKEQKKFVSRSSIIENRFDLKDQNLFDSLDEASKEIWSEQNEFREEEGDVEFDGVSEI